MRTAGIRTQDMRRVNVLFEEYNRVVEQLKNQIVPIDEEMRLTKEQLVWSAFDAAARSASLTRRSALAEESPTNFHKLDALIKKRHLEGLRAAMAEVGVAHNARARAARPRSRTRHLARCAQAEANRAREEAITQQSSSADGGAVLVP